MDMPGSNLGLPARNLLGAPCTDSTLTRAQRRRVHARGLTGRQRGQLLHHRLFDRGVAAVRAACPAAADASTALKSV